MTDRVNALTVILDRDIRTDDVEATINAIRQIKGVLKVKPHIREMSDDIAEARVLSELSTKLWEVLYPREK